MRIIVDANIVFSAILNTNGKIADILINSGSKHHFIAPDFLRKEIRKHHSKLAKLSKLSLRQIEDIEFLVCNDVQFISEEQIKESSWISADKLVSDVDANDTPYIAYAKHFRCKLWTGDKKLIRGLVKKGYRNIITTDELFTLTQ